MSLTKPERLTQILIYFIPVAILGLIAMGCSAPAAEVGKPAPDFRLSDLAGEEVNLSDFEGKPVLLNFWAGWCRPCKEEMPYLQQVYEEWSDRGLVVLTVGRDTPAALAGLKTNDVVTRIGDQDVTTVAAFSTVLTEAAKSRPDQTIILIVRRGTQNIPISIRLPKSP